MINLNSGVLTITSELEIYPGYTFEKFKLSKFYTGQDGIRIIYLNNKQMIDGKEYVISLFFRGGNIYMVSLIDCSIDISEKDEPKRKEIHDNTLKKLGIKNEYEYSWGKVVSDYDERSNCSSINIVYTM